jgi:hypothetical protein
MSFLERGAGGVGTIADYLLMARAAQQQNHSRTA